MNALSGLFLLLTGCTFARAELTPTQIEAKQRLEDTANSENYLGSILAQARLYGIGYRPILKRAINLDKDALVSLFPIQFLGEAAEIQCTTLQELMKLWGDDKFAEILTSQPENVRDLVVSSIDYSWATADWGQYPKTIAASPKSITKIQIKAVSHNNTPKLLPSSLARGWFFN